MVGNRFGRALAVTAAGAVVVAMVPLVGALAAPDPGVEAAVQFDGTNDYVTFGPAPSLGASTFTLETWFKKTGTGVTASTGTGGLTAAIPLVTKGRGEAEGSNVDMNYFLGININGATNQLAADFEDTATGANHPVVGSTVIKNNVWYHAAATYDGTSWRLYLNGDLENLETENATPRSDSIQHAGLGTAMNSTGAVAGYFAGVLDEVRIWSGARTQSEIRGNMGGEITSGAGLLGRWGLDDGTGTTATNSIGGGANGSLLPPTGNGPPTWVDGLYPNTAPSAQSLNLNGSTSNAYIKDSNALDLSAFTVEAWVNRAPGGVLGRTTGSVGVAYPIVAKGRAEGESAAQDVNYFLGVQPDGTLFADFEEDAAGSGATGANHPVTGTTSLPEGEWHHVAAAYDGSTWRLYVDGEIDQTLAVNEPANAANTAPVGIGRAFDSTGELTAGGISAAGGYWSGRIDEVRIWDHARTPAEVGTTWDQELTAGSGLVARYGFSDGSGQLAVDSVNSRHGSLTDAGWGAGFVPPQPPVIPAQPALDFDGVNDHVTFGDPNSLDLSQFTIETWMRRDGAGTTTTTGTDGVPDAIPLVTHGAQEGESPANINMNWFLGINAAGKLVADFEDTVNGTNRPVVGTITIPNDQWHHVAATFDGVAWRLYVDGTLDTVLATNGFQPESSTIQHAALGTSIQSNGDRFGFFDGVLDEARVWNRPLSLAEIQSGLAQELTVGSGLVARWGMNEGTGNLVADTATGGTADGTRVNGPAWVEGTSFASPNRAPRSATILSPADGATDVGTSPNLQVEVNDPDGDAVDVTFYGREANTSAPAPAPFTVVAYPDTQYYSKTYPDTYLAQANWVVANEIPLNIKFVTHLGDIVDSQDLSTQEWVRADAANDILDANLVPYGVVPGNHDINTSGVGNLYDTYFPPNRFKDYGWYGGYLGDGISGVAQEIPSDGVPDSVDRLNKDSYQIINVGSLRFVFINLEYDMPQYTLDWAQDVIDAQTTINPNTEFVLVTHNFVNTSNARPTSPISRSDGRSAEYVWNNLIKTNCEIHLVLNGHYPGEGRRRDLNDCNQPVHQLLADYQSRANGGDGWLRYMTFRPTDNEVDVRTYSPTRSEFETDASSQFTLDFDMTDPGAPFQVIGTDNNVADGGTASTNWAGLANDTQYEWYAISSDGSLTSSSSTASFTTEALVTNLPPTVDSAVVTPGSPKTNAILDVVASGSDPDGPTPTLSYQWQINTGGGWNDLVGKTGTSLNLSVPGNGDRADQLRVVVTASDGDLEGTLNSNEVTVANSAPVAVLDTTTTPKRTAVVVDAASNDTDDDGDAVSVTAVSVDTPADGSAVVLTTGPDAGKVEFTPANGFDGLAALTYTVSDGSLSDTSGSIEVTVAADTTAPDVPTGVEATAVSGGVKVDWLLSGSSDVASYDVFRGQDECVDALCAGVSPVNLSPISHPVATFTDTTAVPGTNYVYFVRATDDSGNPSELSDAAVVYFPIGCPAGEYRVEYFDGVSLSGPVVASSCVSAVDFNFGGGAPAAAPSVGVDTFSIRFTQQVDLAAGDYSFTTTSDDGVRVKVDGNLVIDKWVNQGSTTWNGLTTLTAGPHTVVVEYFENTGSARIQANYQAGCSAGQWKVEYFDGVSLSGPVVASSCVSAVDFNFGGGAPAAAPSVGVDTFSIRFTQQVDLAAGDYSFTTTSDDGVRVKVDGNLVIDKWVNQGSTTWNGLTTLTAGPHTVVVEYFENTGSARIQANYQAGCSAGQWKVEYFDGVSLSGPVVASSCVSAVDFNFGGGAPAAAPSVGVDTFSIRFTQQVDLAAGDYSFTTTSDDGVRVKVDGNLVIDKWVNQGSTTWNGLTTLTAGPHTVVVEYFENTGSARIQANYQAGCSAGQWKVEYFDGVSLSGPVVASSCVSAVDFNFGGGAPAAAPSVGVDTFSIRFTQQVDLAAGDYSFTTTSDDGVRVKVDGNLVIDKWVNQGSTTWNGLTTLTAGPHTVVVEYFENTGSARIQANYQAG